jgi:L-fuconolactonase
VHITDAQLHIWEEHTDRPWDKDYPALSLTPAFPAESAAALMSENGIARAVLDVLPAYRSLQADGSWFYDNSYAEEAIARYPGRFASTLRIDPRHASVASLVAQAASAPHVLALRLVFRFPDQIAALEAGQYHRLLQQAERSAIPVMLFVTGHLNKAAAIARAYPSNLFIIDHVGLAQAPRPVDEPPFKALPELLSLAAFDNIALKLIGTPALSQKPYPYEDLWTPLQRIFDAFGLRRLMWGTDYTRLRHLFTYGQHIDFIRDGGRLSSTDLELLLGGSLRRLLNWPIDA